MVERLPVNNAYEAVKELPGIVEQDGNLTLGGRSITSVSYTHLDVYKRQAEYGVRVESPVVLSWAGK